MKIASTKFQLFGAYLRASAETRHLITFSGLLVALCVGLNVAFGILAAHLNGLLFLDTIGTAIAAIALGPWWGALVGFITNFALSFDPCKQQYFNYLVVNVFCGIAWGYLARCWPRLFVYNDSYIRFFCVTWLLGGVVGFVSAALSLVTTFNFVWSLSSIDPEKFRNWHLTDEYYRWLLKNGVDLQKGTLLDIIPHDIIAILPDKIISVAIAALVVYYTIPRRYIALDKNLFSFSGKLGLWTFLIPYIYCIYDIATVGNVSIDRNTCSINGHTISAVQIALWMVPALIGGCLLLGSLTGKVPKNWLTGELLSGDYRARKYVKLAYNDVISILVGLFTLLVATKQGSTGAAVSAAGEISKLLDDGLGMLAFFGVALFVPGFLMRIAELDPEA